MPACVVIVPDDLLWKVPFEALPSGEGALGERVRVTYATSLATLAASVRPPWPRLRPAATVTAALLAAPAIPAAIRAQVTLTRRRLEGAGRGRGSRARPRLAAIYGDAATVRAKADATEAAARALLETVGRRAPGRPAPDVSGATPLFSRRAGRLGRRRARNDGRWEAREWFKERARPRARA